MITEYKGYFIQEDWRNPYSHKPEFMFYPINEGIQHDGDYDDGWHYTGNCKWAATIEDAKEAIDELILELC